ncbi:SDR family NAD(P)-dependent oxidoreductase [Flavobacterium piscinae]|nr:SDR family NAD(P)-dependent oxidoreductase [Flavobacterium piscinae]
MTSLIIGCSSGIGFELAKKLIERNNKIIGVARREENLLALKGINPEKIVVYALDITEEKGVDKIKSILKNNNDFDQIIFSAGYGDLNEKLNEIIELETINLNVTAFTQIMCLGYDYFKQKGKGHLIAITSIAGIRGNKLAPSYNATKAYQLNYLEGLMQKASNENNKIAITDVRPGFVDTAMAKGDHLFWVASPQKAAEQILNAILKKNKIVYITKRWFLIALILKILPKWLYLKL